MWGKREEKAPPATISCNREKAKCQPGLEGCQAPKTGDTGVPKRDFIIIGHKLRLIIGACCPLIPRKETMTDDHFCSLLVASLPILRRHALHFAATSDEADDLLQDTILRLLEKRNLYQDRNFIGWGYKHLLHLYLNSVRDYKYRPRPGISTLPEGGYEPHIGTAFDIETAIGKLPERQRDTIRLLAQGYGYEEIAERQSIALGTVKSRIARARQTLATLLGTHSAQPKRAAARR